MMDRRQLLAAIGTVVVAGCSGSDNGDGESSGDDSQSSDGQSNGDGGQSSDGQSNGEGSDGGQSGSLEATADSCPDLTADTSRYEPTEQSAILTFERPGAFETVEEESTTSIGAADGYRATLVVRGGSSSIELSQESPETDTDSVPDLGDREEIDTFDYGGREASLQEFGTGSTPYMVFVPHESDDGISYIEVEATVSAADDDGCTEESLNAAAEAILRSVQPR